MKAGNIIFGISRTQAPFQLRHLLVVVEDGYVPPRSPSRSDMSPHLSAASGFASAAKASYSRAHPEKTASTLKLIDFKRAAISTQQEILMGGMCSRAPPGVDHSLVTPVSHISFSLPASPASFQLPSFPWALILNKYTAHQHCTPNSMPASAF